MKLLVDRPEANEVKSRYKVMKYLLNIEWSNLLTSVEKETMTEFLKDAIYVDRLIRKKTEGKDDFNKTVLSQEFQLDELPKME